MKHWYQHRFHTVRAHRIVFSTIPLLPRSLHPPIAVVTALLFLLMLNAERRAVAANLRQITGARGARLAWKVYRVFYSFCDLIVSYCYVPHASQAGLLSMLAEADRGAAQIDRCLAAGKGVIMWTAHLGNPEFASRLLEMHGRTVWVARVVENKPAENMLRDLMSNERLKIVDLSAGIPAVMELMRALRRNEIVAIQGDRLYQRFSTKLPFFSAPAEFPLGPFLLSQASGAPVLPGFVVRERWLRYRVLMGNPIPPVSTGDRDADLKASLEPAVRFLEKTLTSYHDQWLNFFEFWKVAPHG
ncbi:MAG: lysophospholipid acyltransferase family protein [Chloroflexi bacterium]|nr:lysophospholipid acyltransferase family protein [Chloroflexota bacterium]